MTTYPKNLITMEQIIDAAEENGFAMKWNGRTQAWVVTNISTGAVSIIGERSRAALYEAVTGK